MNAQPQPSKPSFFESVALCLLGAAASAFVFFAAGAAVGCFVVGFRWVTQ